MSGLQPRIELLFDSDANRNDRVQICRFSIYRIEPWRVSIGDERRLTYSIQLASPTQQFVHYGSGQDLGLRLAFGHRSRLVGKPHDFA